MILDNVKDALLVSGYEASKPNSGLPDSCLGYFYSSEASNSFQRQLFDTLTHFGDHFKFFFKVICNFKVIIKFI